MTNRKGSGIDQETNSVNMNRREDQTQKDHMYV